MKILSNEISKSLGPGILLAGACIGGSHLMSSTTAGARYGFSLIFLILITNIFKYPFLLIGTRFTSSTGLSLLEGFQRKNKFYLSIYLLISLITGCFTITAVSYVTGLLLTNISVFSSYPVINLSIFILICCSLILLIGQYKILDKVSKFLVLILTLFTLFAVISLLFNGAISTIDSTWFFPEISPYKSSNLSFLIPLMGWMPGPIELCVWPSLWMFSRSKETKYKPSLKEAVFDFNFGYLITVITAIFFVLLGAFTMYGNGEEMLSGSGVSFAQNLIKLYTNAIGPWAKWIIVPAAFAAMFSTTLTCLDAYPRGVSASQGLITRKDFGRLESINERRRLNVWIVFHVITSIFLLLIVRTGEIGVKDFVFAAMTGSFLTAPIFAWMAFDTFNSYLVPVNKRFGSFMKNLCWMGLIFLGGFSSLFILNSFFGYGVQ